MRLVPVALLFFAVGAGAAGCGPPPPPPVTISIANCLVGPHKADRSEWDGTNIATASEIQSLAEALSVDAPYAAVVGVVANYAGQHFSKPDPYGWAEIFVDGAWQSPVDLATASNALQDTFSASWPGSPGWRTVQLDSTVRVRVHLMDDDSPLSDDPIGDAEVRYADLVNARDAGKIVQIEVNDQNPGNTILFVGISVAPQ